MRRPAIRGPRWPVLGPVVLVPLRATGSSSTGPSVVSPQAGASSHRARRPPGSGFALGTPQRLRIRRVLVATSPHALPRSLSTSSSDTERGPKWWRVSRLTSRRPDGNLRHRAHAGSPDSRSALGSRPDLSSYRRIAARFAELVDENVPISAPLASKASTCLPNPRCRSATMTTEPSGCVPQTVHDSTVSTYFMDHPIRDRRSLRYVQDRHRPWSVPSQPRTTRHARSVRVDAATGGCRRECPGPSCPAHLLRRTVLVPKRSSAWSRAATSSTADS